MTGEHRHTNDTTNGQTSKPTLIAHPSVF